MPPETPGDQPDALTELILEQSMAGAAIPVVLFGPVDEEAGTPEASSDPRLVVAEGSVDLYSAEAYVVQCDYGRRILDPGSQERR